VLVGEVWIGGRTEVHSDLQQAVAVPHV